MPNKRIEPREPGSVPASEGREINIEATQREAEQILAHLSVLEGCKKGYAELKIGDPTSENSIIQARKIQPSEGVAGGVAITEAKLMMEKPLSSHVIQVIKMDSGQVRIDIQPKAKRQETYVTTADMDPTYDWSKDFGTVSLDQLAECVKDRKTLTINKDVYEHPDRIMAWVQDRIRMIKDYLDSGTDLEELQQLLARIQAAARSGQLTPDKIAAINKVLD